MKPASLLIAAIVLLARPAVATVADPCSGLSDADALTKELNKLDYRNATDRELGAACAQEVLKVVQAAKSRPLLNDLQAFRAIVNLVQAVAPFEGQQIPRLMADIIESHPRELKPAFTKIIREQIRTCNVTLIDKTIHGYLCDDSIASNDFDEPEKCLEIRKFDYLSCL